MVFAQERCGTVAYEKLLHPGGSGTLNESNFEQWIKNKIAEGSKDLSRTANRTEVIKYTIPVVVHIIHNGEAVGSGLNISDDQIKSQIAVLNKDYWHLNSDSVNTPAEFLPFVGRIAMEFVLAKQDPDGVATSGITRTTGTKTSWTISDNIALKSLNYWPAENYLNIWVTDLSNSSGLIGYAQLPVSNQLQGLETSSEDRLTDGVVIDFMAFGSGAQFTLTPQFNLGRSATHEIGHFFGLRHIWGDASCGTDYVDDTPAQTTSTSNLSSGCPPITKASCESPAAIAAASYKAHIMFQDYMDYSNDVCMNLFSKGQVERMNVIVNNSPRRVSLLSSPAKNAPAPVPNDLGIRQIVSPLSTNCENSPIPKIEIWNYGSNTITSAQIQVTVNGVTLPMTSFSGLNLAPQQSIAVLFNAITLIPATANQIVSFQILQTNGGADAQPANNSASVAVTVPLKLVLPILEPFNSIPTGWIIYNPDGLTTWANVIAPDANTTNKSMYMNFYDYEDSGTQDWLSTPFFTTATPSSTLLKFDLSYAQYTGETGDNLKVYALPGCTSDLTKGILLYDKSSVALATATATTSSFKPASNAQWRKSELISLSNLTVGTNWQLAFVATNGFGNNLYVDNVIITDQIINDLSLTSILTPSLVSCDPAPIIQFSVKNLSTSVITSFQVQRVLNGGTAVTQNYTNVSIGLGEEKIFSLASVNLSTGINVISLTVLNPNGIPDTAPSNDALTFRTYLDQTTDIVPLRKTFDNASESPWLLASPLNFQSWSNVSTNKNQSLVYRSFLNPGITEEAWVVSPVLDFTSTSKNGLFFDISYALRGTAVDRLKVIASTDCGLNYGTVLFDKAGSDFSSTTSNVEWVPKSDSVWKNQFISLDVFSGKKNIRLAFVASNKNGNDMYLDNIEIFADDDPRAIKLAYPYQLYYTTRNDLSDISLSFNLPDRKNVRVQVYSLMGQIIIDNILPNILNQTYYFDLAQQSQGLYIFRLQIDDQVTTTKVFIGH